MTDQQLKRANEINAEIKKIDYFLISAEMVWTGKLIKQTQKYVLKSTAYGAISSEEYELDTETKNEMLDVLRNKRDRLKAELNQL